MTARAPRARWPWAVYLSALTAMLCVDAVVVWQWHSGQPWTYPFWLESTAGAAAYGAAGALIASRVPGNRLGPLMLLVPVAAAVQGTSGVLAQVGASHGWPVAVVAVAGGLFAAAQTSVVGLASIMLFLAPDGRASNRFWRALLRVYVPVVVTAVAFGFLAGPDPGEPGRPDTDPLPGYPQAVSVVPALHDVGYLVTHVGLGWAVVMVPVSMVSLVQRWWQSPPAVRKQVTWPVLGALATPLVIVAGRLVPYPTLYHGDPVWALAVTMLPLGIAVGVFRHGLYGLDRVVSRTVAYTIVTGLVLAVYAGTVTAVSTALPVTSEFAVAAATLTAAAVVRPALSGVQRVIDRRFDREKVDAQRAVDAFAARLADEVDPDLVGAELLAVTRRLLAPSAASLWAERS
ncbi:MAG: hypothetical protein GC157_10300 [Frankiales bacterium]|nr:hypothetical protein [Frankiales bacterium]